MNVLGSNRGELLGKIAKIKLDRGEDPEKVLEEMLEGGEAVGLLSVENSTLVEVLQSCLATSTSTKNSHI